MVALVGALIIRLRERECKQVVRLSDEVISSHPLEAIVWSLSCTTWNLIALRPSAVWLAGLCEYRAGRNTVNICPLSLSCPAKITASLPIPPIASLGQEKAQPPLVRCACQLGGVFLVSLSLQLTITGLRVPLPPSVKAEKNSIAAGAFPCIT